METILLAIGSVAGAGTIAFVTSGGHEHKERHDGRLPWVEKLCSSVCALGARLPDMRQLMPESALIVCDELRSRALNAGWMLDVQGAAVVLVLAGVVLTLVSCLLAGHPLGLVVGAGGSCLAVLMRATALSRGRSRRLSQEMPAVFRTLAVAMGSGKTLRQAIDYVGAQERGIIAGEFSRASLRMRCGSTPQEALLDLESRTDAPGMRLMTAALIIAQRTGSPLRDLFLRSARLVERQGEFRQMLEVKTAQVRLSVRVVCVMPALLVGLLSIISRDFQAGLTSPIGLGCVCAAALLDLLAIYIIRYLMRGIS